MASGLSRKVREIETAVQLLAHLYDRMKWFQPTMNSLVETAGELPTFRELLYLVACRRGMGLGESFPAAWRAALEQEHGALGGEETAILLGLGDILGATDLEGQLAALAFARREMELRLETARADRSRYQKLYSTLGVLAGLAFAIILL